MSREKGIYGLVIIGIITALFTTQLRHVKFNYDFTMFFPKGDADLAYYEGITEEFGMYDDFLYMALFDDNVYSASFLDRVHQLTQTLEAWPETEQVLSVTNFERFQVTPFGLNRIPLFSPEKNLDPAQVSANKQLPGQFFARDGKSTGMVLRHQAFSVKKDGDLFYRKLKQFLDDEGFAKHIVSGKIQAQDEFVQRLENDLGFNLGMAIVLVIVTLALLFRTARGVWIPLLTLLITTVWNIGLYGLLGKELDVLMVIIPPILLIVAMSDVIHLCNKFNELSWQGMSVKAALSKSLKEVGLATLLTSITTAIGFISLAVLPVKPIRDFGIYTGIGILLAYIVAFSLIPCLLLVTGKPVNAAIRTRSFWNRHLPALFLWVLRRRKLLLMSSVFLSLVSLAGISLLKNNTSILVGIEKDDPMAVPVLFFDRQYDGYKPFEMTMELPPDKALFSEEVLQDLERIHEYLENDYGVRHIQSPLVLIKSLNQAINGGASSAFTLPRVADLRRIERYFNASKLRDLRRPLASKDGVTWRINGRCQDLGSAIALEKNEALSQFLKTSVSQDIQFRLTGTSFLIDKTNTCNVKAMFNGLLLAIGIIALLIFLFTRDIRLTLISIFPNALPLLMVGALMGLMQVDLNLSTAIIFSVAFGIAVDDSIHFISRYVLERKKGRQSVYALKRTFLSTGKSIILTSIVLFAGFAIFLNSGFSATYYIGLFVSATLVVALLADLLLLPLLLLRKD